MSSSGGKFLAAYGRGKIHLGGPGSARAPGELGRVLLIGLFGRKLKKRGPGLGFKVPCIAISGFPPLGPTHGEMLLNGNAYERGKIHFFHGWDNSEYEFR